MLDCQKIFLENDVDRRIDVVTEVVVTPPYTCA